jgi:hypothetical protein
MKVIIVFFFFFLFHLRFCLSYSTAAAGRASNSPMLSNYLGIVLTPVSTSRFEVNYQPAQDWNC